MRPLQRLLQEIKDEIAFDPDLLRYEDSLVRRLQNKYTALAESTPYDFFIRTDTLQVRAAVTYAAGGVRNFLTDPLNPRKIDANTPAWINTDWEGNGVFIDPEGTEHQIVKVDSNSIYLDTAPVSDVLTTESWSIVFRSYLLPTDAIQVLGYRDDRAADGWGKIATIGRLTEEQLFLDRDDTGHPRVAIEDDTRQRRAPMEAPTLAAALNGSLPARKYAYRYTIAGAGLESAPSPEAEITLTGAQDQVDVSGFEDIRWDTAAPKESGLRIRLYRRDLTKRSPWVRVAEILASASVSVFNDQTLLPAGLNNWDEAVFDNPEGTRQATRLYYQADDDRIISLRTWFRPRPLQGFTDTPRGPGAVADYLVNSVVADLLSGSEAQKYERRAEQARNNLSAYVGKSDERFVRSSSKLDRAGGARPSPRDRNLGTPTFTP